MVDDQDRRLFIFGGVSGIVGTLCYVIAIVVPLNYSGTYAFAMTWPILSIVFVFSLFRFIERDMRSPTNRLAFLFACLGFALVAVMMSAQLAVKAGMQEYMEGSSTSQQELLTVMRRAIRLVDMGVDVAWDLFIGTSLIFLSLALKGHHDFGLWWAIPAALLGVLVICLNVATFPWPPNTRGLFDVGPVVGVFIIALSTRLVQLGFRSEKRPSRQQD